MNPTPETPPQPPDPARPRPPPAELLLRAFTRLLRPLVRLAIQSGVTFPMLADLLRSLYVDVARRAAEGDPRAGTDSRISLLTGIHRKELRRQRRLEAAPEPPGLGLASQVIARWLGSPALTGADGRPLPLPRADFEALVSGITKDIRPRALLDAWLHQGVAVLDPEGRIRLEAAAFIPQADHETQLYFLARNLADHAAAAAANVIAPAPPAPFLERSVNYDGLSAEAAAALLAIARAAGAAALLEVNRRALAIADADDAAAGACEPQPERTHRVNLGVYLLRASGPDDAS